MIEVKSDFTQNFELNLDGEIWKDISGYEGLYQVSSLSRIKSCEKIYLSGKYKDPRIQPEKIMKYNLVNGYPSLNLSKNGQKKFHTAHRIIGEHFIPNPNNYACINHKNSIRHDIRIENLEWCTYSYNSEHGFRVGGRVQKSGKEDELSKPFMGVNINTKEITIFYSQRQAAIILHTYQANIWKALHNGTKHRNYEFKFLEQ